MSDIITLYFASVPMSRPLQLWSLHQQQQDNALLTGFSH